MGGRRSSAAPSRPPRWRTSTWARQRCRTCSTPPPTSELPLLLCGDGSKNEGALWSTPPPTSELPLLLCGEGRKNEGGDGGYAQGRLPSPTCPCFSFLYYCT